MKGILIEPGAEPVVTTLPDSLWAQVPASSASL